VRKKKRKKSATRGKERENNKYRTATNEGERTASYNG